MKQPKLKRQTILLYLNREDIRNARQSSSLCPLAQLLNRKRAGAGTWGVGVTAANLWSREENTDRTLETLSLGKAAQNVVNAFDSGWPVTPQHVRFYRLQAGS